MPGCLWCRRPTDVPLFAARRFRPQRSLRSLDVDARHREGARRRGARVGDGDGGEAALVAYAVARVRDEGARALPLHARVAFPARDREALLAQVHADVELVVRAEMERALAAKQAELDRALRNVDDLEAVLMLFEAVRA